jgi:hypothetical protein
MRTAAGMPSAQSEPISVAVYHIWREIKRKSDSASFLDPMTCKSVFSFQYAPTQSPPGQSTCACKLNYDTYFKDSKVWDLEIFLHCM